MPITVSSIDPFSSMWKTLEIALLVALGGCATNEEIAARVRGAMTPDRLTPIAACWEPEFEASGFTAQYLLVLDFNVVDDGSLESVAVRHIYDIRSGSEEPAPDAAALGRCIEEKLGTTRLAYEPSGTVHVRGFRLALGDGSRQAREAASERSPHLLIGPRADRCKGLYDHEPPREATVVEAALVEAQAAVDRARDPDALARALQQTYDLALELARRLVIESDREDLPRASRDRMAEQRDRARAIARETGARIGC
jgi:hypothetical protein